MKNLSIVVIPSYQPKKEFIDYTKELSTKVDRIIVVNDGSGQKYSSIFDEVNKLSNAVVLGYSENKGKGYALKQGFLYAKNNYSGEDIIITADCDGQHTIEDILKVYNTSKENIRALVLGGRDFSLDCVPKRSRMGNTSMRFMFKLFYGGTVYDTQTGLRAFSVNTASEFLTIKGNRFEYELAVLIYAQKSRIEIIETKIKTVYPDNHSEHTSHFKTFSDSVKVTSVMLKNIGGYLLSTLISGVFDVGLFTLLTMIVFPTLSPVYSLVAVVVSRVTSSLVNYLINFKIVFKGAEKRSLIKYYILWTSVLIFSYLNVLIFGNLLNNNLIIVKLLGDLILGIISYELQCNWVFKRKKRGNFHGVLANFCKFVYNLFTKKYKTKIKREENPSIYVCRHLNMKGPYTTLKTFDFDLHPMALSAFFDEKVCYNHLKDYTFSKRKGKKPKKFSLKAKVSAFFICNLIGSLKSIPVYRGDNKSIITLKKSLEVLDKGESIIVFPDIEYIADYTNISDIYDGFLYLTEMYKKRTGRTLKIIPLFIDEENREIVKRNEIIINNFKEEKEIVKLKLIEEINVKFEQNENREFEELVQNN